MERDRPLRERLVDVGVELVMREGADSLGLREIARRAGVSHGAPRRYFPTHRALLSAIARRGFADLDARFAAVADDTTSPREQVHALARAYVRYALTHRGMYELMFRHDLLRTDDAPDRPRLRESTLPIFDHIVALLDQQRIPGEKPTALAAATLWASLHGLTELWTWGSLQLAVRADEPDTLDQLVAATLDAHLGAPDR